MVWLLAAPVTGLIAGGVLYAIGLPAVTARRAGIVAGVVTGVALVALFFTAFVECLGENGDVPDSWPWSPRRQFCESGSAEARGGLALLLVPALAVMLGAFLRHKGHRVPAWIAYGVVLATPLLPSLYVSSLPYYLVEEYPVLHLPLLRTGTESAPPRVCYLYGIQFGPRKARPTSQTARHCVDLERTPEALSLTREYDEGRTIGDLDAMADNLTQEGLPIRPGETGVDGLTVARAYGLPEKQARAGATLIR